MAHRPRSTLYVAAVLIAAIFGSARHARADGFDGQRYVPPAGAAGGLIIERPVVPRHLGFGAGLVLSYGLNAVVLRDDLTGDVLAKPLQHAFSADLVGSIGLFNWLEIALHLPLHLGWAGDDTVIGGQQLSASPGIGDIQLVPKVAFWLGGTPSLNFSIGGLLALSFPSGNEDALRGAGGVRLEPRLLFGMGAARWMVYGSFGVRPRFGSKAVDFAGPVELTWGVAATFGLLTGKVPLDLQLDLAGSALPGSTQPGAVKVPLELLGGVIVKPHPEWSITAAVGPGLTRGLGTPDVRFILGVRFAHRVPGRDRYTDRDNDHVPDYRDDCPDAPEDYDGFQDEDGCPDPDNDHDGILDNDDECPTQAEEPGGDGDGCPDKARVIIRRGRVAVFGKILFRTNSAKIRKKSEPLVDELARVFKEHPEITQVTIEGHTDNVGDPGYNRRLSKQRAESVKRALVARGVDASRLRTAGLGQSRPIAPNDTPAGRARNRRVEFRAKRK